MRLTTLALLSITGFGATIQCLTLQAGNVESTQQAASQIAHGLMSAWYTGNQTGGTALLPKPYYWWEAGAMYGGLVDYWGYTGDDSYNENVGSAIISQASPTMDFMMLEQRDNLGNDDQAFWALGSMSALEQSFPVPEGSPDDIWLRLSVNAFNDFVSRWDMATCGGGLRWQIFPENKGYTYKNTISNGAFFQLGARLARYTGNNTYSAWAEKAWDWMEDIEFINSTDGRIFDGAGDENGAECRNVKNIEWSYNAAMLSYGAAIMWDIANQTDSTQASSINVTKWSDRTRLLVRSASSRFFTPYPNATNIMFEAPCERVGICNNDQFSFKAYLSRWLAKSVTLHSELGDIVMPKLEASAEAAAQSCTGDASISCGTKWWVGSFDGVTGPGQMMSAMETVIATLAVGAQKPGTLRQSVVGIRGGV